MAQVDTTQIKIRVSAMYRASSDTLQVNYSPVESFPARVKYRLLVEPPRGYNDSLLMIFGGYIREMIVM